MGVFDFAVKFVKQATGIQALEDKRKAQQLMEEAEAVISRCEQKMHSLTSKMNSSIQQYQCTQELVLSKTIGVMREFLKDLPFGRDDKEYTQIDNIHINIAKFEVPDIKFKTSETLKTIGMGIAFGVFAAGYVASKYRAQKLTEATAYHTKAMQYQAECERQWVLMEGVIRRSQEQESVLTKLGDRAAEQLEYLRPLIYEFMVEEEYYSLAMEKVRVFLKPIGEICSTPILTEAGNLDGRWNKLQSETKLLLESNL